MDFLWVQCSCELDLGVVWTTFTLALGFYPHPQPPPGQALAFFCKKAGRFVVSGEHAQRQLIYGSLFGGIINSAGC